MALPVALYGIESWALSKRDRKNYFGRNNMSQGCKGLHVNKKISNANVRQGLQICKFILENKITECNLNWFNYLERMQQVRHPKFPLIR